VFLLALEIVVLSYLHHEKVDTKRGYPLCIGGSL
jgi:hypothetical protein